MCKKSLTCILVLFAALLMMIHLEPVDAVCCGATNGLCEDGTKGTPNCGRGPCNIFGCNCDNGCRDRWGSWLTGYGGTKWLFNCDFPGNDIGNQELGGEQCGNVCNLKEPQFRLSLKRMPKVVYAACFLGKIQNSQPAIFNFTRFILKIFL